MAEQAGFQLTETKMYQDIDDAQPKLYNFYEMTAPVKGLFAGVKFCEKLEEIEKIVIDGTPEKEYYCFMQRIKG